jgi:hypothetical protein
MGMMRNLCLLLLLFLIGTTPVVAGQKTENSHPQQSHLRRRQQDDVQQVLADSNDINVEVKSVHISNNYPQHRNQHRKLFGFWDLVFACKCSPIHIAAFVQCHEFGFNGFRTVY